MLKSLNYDKRAPRVIRALRFAPYMFSGYQGVLTVKFGAGMKAESINWDRGLPKADTAYLPHIFQPISELVVEGKREELDQIAKQLKTKYGDPKLSDKASVVMYSWSDPTRDLYVFLRDGRVGYWYKPLTQIK